MTLPGMPTVPDLRRNRNGQWKLSRFQVVNWGGFEGHHDLIIDELGTLISGGSGTGKSTILDAHIALVQDSNVAFNGASNNSGTGRARSLEQRNLLSYMRGQIDVSRGEDASTRQNLLRGDQSATWSAIAETYRHTDGSEHTLLRVMFAAASATHPSDIKGHLIQTPGTLSLKQLEAHASDGFERRRLRQSFSEFTFFESHTQFAAAFHQRLGIGRDGDGAPAMRMLARIQASETITSVDSLFKNTVLERPKTYEAADRAVLHFQALVASHEQMRTAEAQINLLTPITDLASRLEAARSELGLLDTFRLSDPSVAGPVTLWAARLRKALLESEAATAKANAAEAAQLQGEAVSQVRELDRQLRANQQAQKDNGGDALADLGIDIASAQTDLAAAEAARTEFAGRASVFALPESAEAFTELQTSAQQTVEAYPKVREDLNAELEAVRDQQYPLLQRQKLLREELDYFAGRRNLIPRDLDAARHEIARHVGVSADELTFVAELLDLRPEYEPWRQAAELLLGGFARTLLVDRRHTNFRTVLDSLKLGKRINFQLVDTSVTGGELDETTLPGRLTLDKTSPFAGWLRNELARQFAYECLEAPDFPDDNRRRITITGQVQNGNRGSHGGHGQARILGYSTQERIGELEAEKLAVEQNLVRIERNRADVRKRITESESVKDASVYVLGLRWTQLDTGAAQTKLDTAQRRYTELLETSDTLAALKELAGELSTQLAEWRDTEVRQRDLHEQEHKRWGQLVDEEDETGRELDRLEAAEIVLTDEQTERLDLEYTERATSGSSPELDTVLGRMRLDLLKQTQRSQLEINSTSSQLTSIFSAFLDRWKHDNLGTSRDSYPEYQTILDKLNADGLADRRAEFTKRMIDWSSEDLLDLLGAFEDSIDEIRNRLDPVNLVLAGLAYGAGRDQLQIKLRVLRDADVTAFRQSLTRLASSTTRITEAEVDARFTELGAFIAKIDRTPGNGRDQLLDVRRHVHIEAEKIDRTTGAVLACYDSLGNKSGGETQELVAFILGAALRYRLGTTDGGEPGYATVILDEGFIKADSEFAGRALSAWQGLGFQLVVGAPMDKVSAIEPYVNRVVSVTKKDGRSYTQTFDMPARVTRPDLTAGPGLRVINSQPRAVSTRKVGSTGGLG